MQNLLDELTQLLQKDDRFTADGKLLKNKVIEAALQLDPALLKLLLSHKSVKKHFFVEVDGISVFDKTKFQKFISNKSFLPDSYTAFKNKIGLTSNDEFISEGKEVVLSWPYKDCVLEGGQTKEDEKRNEIFWNETLAPDEIDRLLSPKVFTNFKKYDSKGEHKITDISLEDNLIIKGNNLLALHSLLPIYSNKVKLIYIDPPYNTGSSADTFAYNNSFKRSSWATFMLNRLVVAKSLLSDNGVMIAAIDDYEQHTLRFVLDEIFGADNRLGTVVVVHNPRGRNDDKYFATMHEYLLVYAKNKDLVQLKNFEFTEKDLKQFNKQDNISAFSLTPFTRTGNNSQRHERPNLYYPIYYNSITNTLSLEQDKNSIELLPINADGEEKTWRWGKETFEQKKKTELLVKKVKGEFRIFKKRRPTDIQGRKPKTVWSDPRYDASSNGIMLLRSLLGKNEFSYPKSLFAVMDIIKILSDKNDIILDFFAGSGTTAQAVMELNKEDDGNRKFILCEQMEYIENVTKERTKKIIANSNIGSFNYCALAELNQQFIHNIYSAKTTKELKEIWDIIKRKGFISYKVNPKEIDKNISDFEQLSLKDQKKFLVEVLDKNHLYVNYSEIDDKDYKIPKEDKMLNKKFYSLK